MLVDASVTIAYKCSACGTFEFYSISVFKLKNKKEYEHKCRCGKSRMHILKNSLKSFTLSIPCISCGSGHTLNVDTGRLITKGVNVFYCPQTGMQYSFIGNDIEVRRKIDKLEKELDELMTCFGYDSYFKNTQVMFDSLNKIHEIAEAGNLYCLCGCDDIELTLLSDKIQLRCKKCMGSKIVYASSNEDLKNTLTSRQILIGGGA